MRAILIPALAALGIIAFAFLGGITMVTGALLGAILTTEAFFPHVFDAWFGLSGTCALLLGGVGVIFNLDSALLTAAGLAALTVFLGVAVDVVDAQRLERGKQTRALLQQSRMRVRSR